MPRRRILEEDAAYRRLAAAGIAPNEQVTERVEVISEAEERKLRAKEEQFLRDYHEKRQAEARKRTEAASKGVRDLTDAKLKAELKKLYAEHADLESQWKALKEQMKDAAARIAALSQEENDRKKAGWLTATIGGPPENQLPGVGLASGLGIE